MLSDNQQRIMILRALPNGLFEANYLILSMYIWKAENRTIRLSAFYKTGMKIVVSMEVGYGYTTWYKG